MLIAITFFSLILYYKLILVFVENVMSHTFTLFHLWFVLLSFKISVNYDIDIELRSTTLYYYNDGIISYVAILQLIF